MIVITDTRRGGAPHRIAAVARGMTERGWSIHVVSLLPGGPVLQDLSSAGIETSTLDITGAAAAARGVLRLRGLLRKDKPALVQSSLWHANLVARVCSAGLRVPVVNAHESTDDEKLVWRVALDRSTLRLASCHYAVSEAVAGRIVERDGVPRERMRVIPGGVDPARWRPTSSKADERRRLGIPPEAVVAGWTGRCHEAKNLPVLLQAVARLDGWWLLLIGDGPQREYIADLARSYGCEGRVVMTGEVKDVAPLLHAMDVFCLSSLWEGLPTALLEAMAAALPVVATSVGGIPEIIADGENGLLVPPEDPEAMAEAMRAAVGRDDLGARALVTVEERFSVRAMIDAHEQLWQEVIEQSGRGVTRRS